MAAPRRAFMTRCHRRWPIASGRIFDESCCMGSNVAAGIRGIVSSGTSPRARRRTSRVRVPRPVMPCGRADRRLGKDVY